MRYAEKNSTPVRWLVKVFLMGVPLFLISTIGFGQALPSVAINHPQTTIKVTHFGYCRVCPKFSVVLASDGRVIFEGKEKVKSIGQAEGVIPSSKALDLSKMLESIGFWTLSNEYINSMTPDAEWYEITFQKDGQSKAIRFNVRSGETGIKLYRFVRTFDATVNVRQWICPAPERDGIICADGNWTMPTF